YATWSTLRAHHPEIFEDFIVTYRQRLSGANFADPPEILPGWSLRMNVHADGQGYDVMLQDMQDTTPKKCWNSLKDALTDKECRDALAAKKCWYAALTDESGVIRQSKAIDCEI